MFKSYMVILFIIQTSLSSHMNEEGGIDWYRVSKMDSQKIDLNQFNQIVSVRHPQQAIDRVSLQYKRKLLLMFQNASAIIKQDIANLAATRSELIVKRNIVADELAAVEGEVQNSFKQFTNMKFIINEKKRLRAKLKDRLQKKGGFGNKIYVCSICNKQDFTSIETLRSHTQTEHREMRSSNNNNVEMTQLKDLLMTMKDKQIEMMSMFLRASREMQTQKLQTEYQGEYKKFMHVSATKTEESREEPQELKGQSQFLFFQRSDQFRRQMERDQQFRRKLSRDKTQRQTLNNQFFQQKNSNYYNAFGAIQQNKSEHIDEGKQSPKKVDESRSKTYGYYDPNQFLSKFLKQHESSSRQSRFSLVQNTPKPYIELKEAKNSERESQYVPPSISDRLKQQNSKKGGPFETMFTTKRKFYEQAGYVFNSGPLVDDKGGDSDYDDYFGNNQNLNMSIQDEEIKANFTNGSKSGLPPSKDSFHLSKLLSPKDQSSSSLMDKSVKDKSSVIVDLSDSFSKRDFQISKDDDTINLSDLKLSKLEKKRQQEKLTKMKEGDRAEENKSVVSQSNVSFSKMSKNSVGRLGPIQKTEIQVLKQFQKPQVVPLREQQSRFTQQSNSINMFVKPNDRTNVINGLPPMNNFKHSNSQNRLGVLNEFLKEQFKGQGINSREKRVGSKGKQ